MAPDGSFLAVAIENQRDEDFRDGRVGPMPAGSVFMVDLTAEGLIDCDTARVADATGLADIAPEDPEPEFVSINGENEIGVTMQENNHIVILSSSGEVLSHFSAGEVTLEGIDTDEEGALIFDQSLTWPREPDSVTWIDNTHFAIANEGDMDGGTRGWTIFSQDGEVVYKSGTSSNPRSSRSATIPKSARATRVSSRKALPSTCSTARPSSSSAPSGPRSWAFTTSPVRRRRWCGSCCPRA